MGQVLNDKTVPILVYVSTGNLLLVLLNLGCTSTQKTEEYSIILRCNIPIVCLNYMVR